MQRLLSASLAFAVTSVLIAQEQTAPESFPTKSALAEFKRDQGGDWVVKWNAATGTPGTIYGTGLRIADWRENSLTEARRHANRLLREQADLLGLGTSTFTETIGQRMGRTWTFTFDQSFRGIPVLEGRADIRINMSGVVAMLGSRAWPIPADFNTVPAIGNELAQATAWDALGGEPAGNAPAPRLVIWGDATSDKQAPFFLAWEVSVHELGADGRYGRYYIDAQTNRVLHWHNDKHNCYGNCKPAIRNEVAPAGPTVSLASTPKVATDSLLPVITTVTLMAWTRTGTDAWSALQNVPLPNIVVNVPGIGQRTTDANGQFDIDITSPVTISISQLNGVHHAPITGGSAPSGSVTVQPGVNATIQLLSAGANSAQAAHTTAAYWTDRTNVWMRSILGNTSQLNTASNVGVDVNINDSCNAFYTGNTTNYYQEGGGCANTAFSTVIAHEWGHGIDDRYGGIANSVAEGLSEGWGDIIGMYMVDSPLLGSGFQSPGSPLRNGNNNRVWPYTSGASPHGAGEVWMGWAWRFREALRASMGTTAAVNLSNELVIGTLAADATTREGAVLEVFLADDDDGNLLNGTPHYNELESASLQKGIPYPEVQLATISHTALGNTNQRLVPREVIATVVPVSGTVGQPRIVFDAGSGNVTRNMHPTGNPDQWVAMLPGLDNGIVSYRIETTHSTGPVVTLPSSGDFSYQIDSGTFATFWSDDFEGGTNGWTHNTINGGQDDWQLGAPAGKSGTSQGVSWQDPTSAYSGSNVWANDIGQGNWNGRYNGNVQNFLRSPVIDCSGRTGVRVRFQRWLSVEERQYDEASLYCNGQLVWQNDVSGNIQQTGWLQVEYLVPWADNNPAVQFQFNLVTDGGLHLGGWAIDDFEVGETVLPTTDADLRWTPEQATQGDPMTMQIDTPSSSRPYLLLLGDAIGPTVVPGFPVVFVGGNYIVVGGSTDATGSSTFGFMAPSVPSAVSLRYYSQVFTIDATFTNFVTSNRSVNLITQTP